MKKYIFILTIVTFLNIFNQSLHASSFSITPDKIINNNFDTQPYQLKIFNSSIYPITLTVDAVFFEPRYDTDLIVEPMDERSRSRVSFEESFIVEPNTVKDFPVSVINNFTKVFNFALVFTEQITPNSDKTNTVGRIIVPVLTSGRGRVLGISTGQNLFELETNSLYTNNIIDFDLKILNTSTENIIPQGVISIKSKVGFINEATADFNNSNRIVLADSERFLGDRIELSGFNFGIATLKLDLLYGNENTVYRLEKDILIVPIYIIALPFIMIGSYIYIRKKRLNAKNNK